MIFNKGQFINAHVFTVHSTFLYADVYYHTAYQLLYCQEIQQLSTQNYQCQSKTNLGKASKIQAIFCIYGFRRHTFNQPGIRGHVIHRYGGRPTMPFL